MEKNWDPGSGMEKIQIRDKHRIHNTAKFNIFLTPKDGGEEEGEEPEYGEGEEEGEGLQEREQRAKQRQIMKEIRAKKVRDDTPIKKILSLKKTFFFRKSHCSAISYLAGHEVQKHCLYFIGKKVTNC
jgi:hypothetical protein